MKIFLLHSAPLWSEERSAGEQEQDNTCQLSLASCSRELATTSKERKSLQSQIKELKASKCSLHKVKSVHSLLQIVSRNLLSLLFIYWILRFAPSYINIYNNLNLALFFAETFKLEFWLSDIYIPTSIRHLIAENFPKTGHLSYSNLI